MNNSKTTEQITIVKSFYDEKEGTFTADLITGTIDNPIEEVEVTYSKSEKWFKVNNGNEQIAIIYFEGYEQKRPKYEVTETHAFYFDGTAETVEVGKRDVFSGNTWFPIIIEHDKNEVLKYETSTWFEY